MGRKATLQEDEKEDDLDKEVTWHALKYGSSKDMTSSDNVTETKNKENAELKIKIISSILKMCTNPCGCHRQIEILLKSHEQPKNTVKESSKATSNQMSVLRKTNSGLNFETPRSPLKKIICKKKNKLNGSTKSSSEKENTLVRGVSADSGFLSDSYKQSVVDLVEMDWNTASTSGSPTLRYSPRIANNKPKTSNKTFALTETSQRNTCTNRSIMTPRTRKELIGDENAANSGAESHSSESMSSLNVSFSPHTMAQSDFLDSVGLTKSPKDTLDHFGILRKTVSPKYKGAPDLARKEQKSTPVLLDSSKLAKTQKMTKNKTNFNKSSVEGGARRKSMRVVRPPVNIIDIRYQDVIDKMLLERRQQEEKRKQQRDKKREMRQSSKLSPDLAKKGNRPKKERPNGSRQYRTSPRLAKNKSFISDNSHRRSGSPKRKKRRLYSPEHFLDSNKFLQMLETEAKD